METTQLTPEEINTKAAKMEEIRKQLIAYIDRVFIPEDKWDMPDYPNLMIQTGELYALLKCGCEFRMVTENTATPQELADKNISDKDTLFIAVTYLNKDAYVSGQPVDKTKTTTSMYFLPTEAVLKSHRLYK